MSATARVDLISPYFSSCPVVNVSGRAFPVEEFYIEDIHKIVRRGQLTQSGLLPPPSQQQQQQQSLNDLSSTKSNKKKKNNNSNSQRNYSIPHIDEEEIAEFIIRLIQKENFERNQNKSFLSDGKFYLSLSII